MTPLARLALLVPLWLPAAPALAEGAKTIIILDGSGSMAGKIDGRTKAEIARETVTTVLETLPEEREIGLMAYGHRSKGDCRDIELIVPPAPGTADRIRKAVSGMKFLGKTPLSDAVRQAAGELRFTEEKATVVLVTDGIESCEADPCALGRELAQEGIDFKAHVVGFGLSEQDGAAVACLAEATGGRYLAANDAAGLADALMLTVAVTDEPPAEHFPGAEKMAGVLLVPTGRTFGKPADPPAAASFPADGTPDQCQAICAADRFCGSWQFEPPGSLFVAEPRCRLYGRDAELDYEIHAPDLTWVSGMKADVSPFIRPYQAPDADGLTAGEGTGRTVAVTITAAGLGADVPVSWSAIPLRGQTSEAVAMPDSLAGPWENSLEPGPWLVKGQASDGAMFEGEIDVPPGGGPFEIPQVYESKGMGEDAPAAVAAVPASGALKDAGIAVTCDAEVPCRFTDGKTGLVFQIAKGFGASEVVFLKTAAGAQASLPTVEIFRLDTVAAGPMIALNPRQWPLDLGPCIDIAAGKFCARSDAEPDAIAVWAGNLSEGLPKLP